MLRRLAAPAITDPNGSGIRVQLLKKIADKKDAGLKAAIRQNALNDYGQPAKPQQIETVFHLARGQNTFLLAGTGFGKSRIPEMYYSLLPKSANGVILVLNPLDALGDNQVLEKKKANFTAINLTKLTFNIDEANNIVNGVYSFVYLSPEIFLNSKLFDQVYFCPNFQNRLALVVVDEAHVIHQWGLVESSRGKDKVAARGRIEDLAIFRPYYGKIGGRLLTRNNKPILLMSATCRPVAMEGIKKSLKLEDHNLEIVQAELTRPELRIIRVPITSSMAKGLELSRYFPSVADVPDAFVVPTLIYSSTRNRTLHVMTALDVARKTPGSSLRPNSTFVRRFHSCTGEKDKSKLIEDFGNGELPVISCTMALGMGQNWSRVRCVIQMGRAEPSAICQMIGRAGRDGRPGLTIIFVEKTRKNGKNKVAAFAKPDSQGDTDRMDALAVTPVCLRIAFAVDNALGYIPLSVDDPSYKIEKAREEAEQFVKCKCSNCMPQAAEGLMKNFSQMTTNNMDTFMDKDWSDNVQEKRSNKRKGHPNPSEDIDRLKRVKLTDDLATILKARLRTDFDEFFDSTVKNKSLFGPEDLFGDLEIASIVEGFDSIESEAALRKMIGGQMIAGQISLLHRTIQIFREGPLAKERSDEVERVELAAARTLEKELEAAEVQAREEAAAIRAKEIEDERRRMEIERCKAKRQAEDLWKEEQAKHLAMLVRLAGEDAERRGVASIHRGR
ncbi:ATP-dependent DNA helicase sgs1 [Puccinia graminis f. sp. tritici]|uniref:DNA 3'-5' helicase n=1 Tax=Puccinia graminis f. sp. tritici TaxID=56615 RepID=A0A5B0MFQ4_PUCGR|nr:ATP-dependent DNA helicase sgs1 [Puccinia graminis f. sp. tritici]